MATHQTWSLSSTFFITGEVEIWAIAESLEAALVSSLEIDRLSVRLDLQGSSTLRAESIKEAKETIPGATDVREVRLVAPVMKMRNDYAAAALGYLRQRHGEPVTARVTVLIRSANEVRARGWLSSIETRLTIWAGRQPGLTLGLAHELAGEGPRAAGRVENQAKPRQEGDHGIGQRVQDVRSAARVDQEPDPDSGLTPRGAINGPSRMSLRSKVRLVLSIVLATLAVTALVTLPPQSVWVFLVYMVAGVTGVGLAAQCLRTPFDLPPATPVGAGVGFIALTLAWAAIPTSGVQLIAGAPVTVRVAVGSHDQRIGFCDRYAVNGGTPDNVALPQYDKSAPVTREIEQGWVAKVRGTDIAMTRVTVEVQGKTGAAVRLTDPVAVIDSATVAETSTTFAFQYGCGSEFTARHYAVRLDAGQTRIPLRPVSGEENGQLVPAPSTQLQVSESDPETLEVEAVSASTDAVWHIEMNWSSGGTSGVLVFQPNGRSSFRTLGDRSVSANWVPIDGRWMQI